MKVIMRHWENMCITHAQRFTKSWEYHCTATDAFSAGYKQAREDCAALAPELMGVKDAIKNVGEEKVEVVIENGTHQLSIPTFEKWQKEVRDIPFKEALKTFLSHYQFEDVRVVEADNGVISFQGLCKKKDSNTIFYVYE